MGEPDRQDFGLVDGRVCGSGKCFRAGILDSSAAPRNDIVGDLVVGKGGLGSRALDSRLRGNDGLKSRRQLLIRPWPAYNSGWTG